MIKIASIATDIVEALNTNPSGLTASTISDIIGVEQPKVVAIIKEFEMEGLIDHVVIDTNTYYKISEEGKKPL